MIILYSTNFYTYVNELNNIDLLFKQKFLRRIFSNLLALDKLHISFLFVLRFNNLYRSNLILFSFLIPLILLIFRNTEFISSLLGRSVTNETFISINFDNGSKFRNLRIVTFRKNLGAFSIDDQNFDTELIKIVDNENKKNKINLIIIQTELDQLSSNIEKYLINLNKKVLIISKNKIDFKNRFIFRKKI